MVEVKENTNYTVVLTEQTVNELGAAISRAKQNPGVDTVIVKSAWCPTTFEIQLETMPNSQESLGYRLEGPKKVNLLNKGQPINHMGGYRIYIREQSDSYWVPDIFSTEADAMEYRKEIKEGPLGSGL